MRRVVLDRSLLARTIDARCEARAISRREAAKEIGVSPSCLTRIAKNKAPDVDSFLSICDWLQLEPLLFARDARLRTQLARVK